MHGTYVRKPENHAVDELRLICTNLALSLSDRATISLPADVFHTVINDLHKTGYFNDDQRAAAYATRTFAFSGIHIYGDDPHAG